VLLEAVQNKNNNYYYIIIALNHYSFLLFFQNTKPKKNKLKDIQSKIQENIINASVTGQEIERK
jgi:hypothetical protein